MFFPNCLIEPTDSVLRLKISGSRHDLLNVMQCLTITNKSISWQIYEAKRKLKDYRTKGIPDDSIWSQWQISTLNELKGTDTEELFVDCGDYLIIPAGFFYIAPNSSDFMVNKDVTPYYLPNLRDYQKRAVMEVLKYKRGSLEVATGLGKSLLLASVVLSLVKAGKRVMVVVPSEYLVGQLTDTISKYHDSVTSAGGDRHPKLGCDVLVVTAMSAKKYASSYSALAVDEAHHSSAQTWQDLLTANEDMEYVYSCSATVFRNDGLDLMIHAMCGPVLFSMSVREGIQQGWLCKPSIYQIQVSTDQKINGIPATKAYKTLVQDDRVFNLLKTKIISALAQNHKIIVIFKTVIAGRAFAKYAKDLNLKVADAKFKKPLHDFANGETEVLIASSQLVSEGVNIPNASMIFILTNHSSDITSYQAIGRVLRNAGGKEKAIVVDIATMGYKQFERASQKRLAVYKDICDDVFTIKY